ncbi:DUF4430 domain-containing protein [Cohnella sp.]|uniref:DUF4430 domain-containing protein n=1 Tax=Cohnella sp. TaxID=1883426 RepID=UPI0035652E71
MWGLVLLVVFMLLTLIGCSGGKENVSTPSKAPSSSATTNSETSQASATPTDEGTKEQVPAPSSFAASSSEAAESTEDKDVSKAETSQPSSPSVKPSVKPQTEPSAPVVDTITIKIIGNADWGTVLAEEKVELSKGDTPADVLIRAAKAHRFSYEIRGSGALTYVEGIDGLYEFDDGPTSGWKYRVNGKVAGIGAGAYELKPGDHLEWFYGYEDIEAEEDKEPAS